MKKSNCLIKALKGDITMIKNIYKKEKCSYCDDENTLTRPSPFMADRGAMMCKYCWDMTKEEYANSNGE